MLLIGAGFILAGIVLEGAMWFSNRGGDVVSNRVPPYTTGGTERFVTQPQRIF